MTKHGIAVNAAKMCDYNTLALMLQNFAEQAKIRPLTLGEVVDSLDEVAYAFLAIILVLPFMQPIPLGPFTVACGVAFILLGWQLLHGHESPVLPRRLREMVLHEKTWRAMVKISISAIGFCRKLTRPRYQHLVTGVLGQRLNGLILLWGGLLLAAPFPIPLPFNNTLPAIAILFYCIGELEEDGLMVFISLFWLAATSILFAAYYFALWFFGKEALVFAN